MDTKKRNARQSKTRDIHFLSDEPLTVDKLRDIRFGHLGIAQNLKKMIAKCPTPFTIGLFGKWGTGKTTILNLLQDYLKQMKIAAVKFDIWKHETDSLRITFLKEITRQLKDNGYLTKKFKLSDNMESTISRTYGTDFKLDKTAFKMFGVAVFFLLLSIGLVTTYFPKFLSEYIRFILNVSFVSTLIIFLLKRSFTSENVTKFTDRFKVPQEFEKEFIKIISKIKSDKIVIIIDNLDRTLHEKAVELLSTVKTFLEQKKCTFLIACDDDAIKEHLQSVYLKENKPSENGQAFDADEFLRKFFNASLRIPQFIDTELQAYTESLLKETGIKELDSADVAFIITTAFRENPRQVKQLINTLISHFLLAEGRESKPDPQIVPQGAITKHVDFLTKLLIMRQKYPREYRQICEQHLIAEEMEELGGPEYKAFLVSTRLATVDDIRPFIYFKQSSEELTIPGVRELELALIDNKKDIANQKLQAIKTNAEHINNLERYLLDLINRNFSRRMPLLNIISCTLEVLKHHNIEFKTRFYSKIANILNNETQLKSELNKFKPNVIFQGVLGKCSKKDRTEIIAHYLEILNKASEEVEEQALPHEYIVDLFSELVKYKEWLNNQKQLLKQILAQKYYTSKDILALFVDDANNQKEFVSSDVIGKFASTFSDSDVDNMELLKSKNEVLLNYKAIITYREAQIILNSYKGILNNENKKPYREERENLLLCIEDTFAALHQEISDIQDKPTLDSFAESVFQGINTLDQWNQKSIYIFTSLELVDMLTGNWHNQINTQIHSFFTKADFQSIKFVFDKFKKVAKRDLLNKYPNIFQSRAMQQDDIFDFLFPYVTTEEARAQWLIRLSSINIKRLLNKLKQLNYIIPKKQKLTETLLQIVQRQPINDQMEIYNAINKMKCAHDVKLKETLASYIKAYLASSNLDLEQLGFSVLNAARTYFSESLRRDIARKTIEWLRTLNVNNANHPHAIKSVLVSWNIIQLPVKNEYIDFIFDKLIKRNVNIECIQLGFEILMQIRIKYEEYSAYFDDVIARIETETNAQIKTELISGLLKLKPKSTKHKNQDYWRKVETF